MPSLYTFFSLVGADERTLHRAMEHGVAPELEELVGFEFRGWNRNSFTRWLRIRKFKKGFFGDPAKGHAWGYNVVVRQNGLHEPWLAEPSEEAPRRHYFFRVLPAPAGGPRHPSAVAVDYGGWDGYLPLNPVRLVVDLLVRPDPADHDLILGRSYLRVGWLRLPLGYFVLERHNASDYDPGLASFSQRERRTLEAFAEVAGQLSEETLSPGLVSVGLSHPREGIMPQRIRSLKLALFLLEYVHPRRCLWPFRPPFSKMTPVERKRFVERTLERPRSLVVLKNLAKIWRLFVAGYYGDPAVYPSIGFVPVPDRTRYQAGQLKPLGLPQLQPTVPATGGITCDLCVIGSGAAGAVVAYNAAAAGRDVVLLEEGPYVPAAEVTHDEAEMRARLYKEGGLQATADLGLAILQGRCLGGSTVVNNAICFRLGDQRLAGDGLDVLEAWARLGARIDRAELEESYARVERAVGVGPLLDVQDPGVSPIDGTNARILLEGWAGLVRRDPELARWTSGLFHKNYRRCLGCGYCNFGCPYERKLSMLETYIPKAMEAGARVVVGCEARAVSTERGRATEVLCRLRGGCTLTVKASAVVVSCGAIASSVLLMRSGVGRNVGYRFSFNASTPMMARFPSPVHGFDGVQMGAYVDLGEAMLESIFFPPQTFAVTLPGWFRTHFVRMKAYDRFASAGVLIATEPDGRVKRTPFLRSVFGPVTYHMSEADLGKLRRGMARLADIFFEAGAEAVHPAALADVTLEASRFRDRPDDISRFLDDRFRRPEELMLTSAHPQGGNAMSDDPSIGVVDSAFRVHGHDNLFVCDASVFPTSIRINPQLTIMALADYFARLGLR